MTTTEMALTLGAGVRDRRLRVCGRPPAGARTGCGPPGLLLAFAVLTALSIVWSVQPDHSWQDSGRMLAYSGVFAAGVALVRIVPDALAGGARRADAGGGASCAATRC